MGKTKPKKSVASRAGSPGAGARARATRATGGKPIDLYYWPTPNGWKIW